MILKRKNNLLIEKSREIKLIQRLVITLLVAFSVFLLSILYVDKISENNVLRYVDVSYQKADEFIKEESNSIGVERVEELNELKIYNKELKEDIKIHKDMTYVLFTISAMTLMALVFSIKIRVNKHREKIESMLLIDEITGGDSSAAFSMKMDEFVKKNPPSTYTVALMNVKNFKLVNNNYGFTEGDKILKYIYDMIDTHLNEEEFLCRGEIDNFFVCIKENDEEVIKRRLKEIETDINKFNGEYDNRHTIQFAFGLALIENVNIDHRTIMNYARFSCSNYKKTREFKNYSKIVEELSRENTLSHMFESSLKNGEFKVYLQPKINIKNNKCRGAEALVRWIHPEEGMISPGEFINIFEENDKIIELDFYVFEEVCKIIRFWIDNNKNIVPISVNLSRKHLKDTIFIDKFVEIKNKYNVPDDLIEFEILESLALDDEKINILISILDKIHENGFLCSLDDFGSGYSLLSVLGELKVDTIKLDRKFFRDFEDERSKNVIESFINVCKRINTKVVAEGIESEEQLDFLRKVNCELVQGFVFSRAIDIESFEKSFLVE